MAREFDLHELAVEDAVHAHQRAEARALRRHAVLRPAPRPLRRRDGDGRVRRGARVRRPALRDHRPPRRGAGPRARCAAASRRAPTCCGAARWRSCTRSWTASSTTTRRSSPAWRTTSTRSRTRSSAAAPTCRAASTSSSREVIAFQRATKPLAAMLERLMRRAGGRRRGAPLPARRPGPRAPRRQEQADGFRELLQNILSVNLTLETKALSEISNAQNEEVKKISAWAAILFAPTLVGTIYGMNFDHMPELDWQLGYPFALGADAARLRSCSTACSSAAAGSDPHPSAPAKNAGDAPLVRRRVRVDRVRVLRAGQVPVLHRPVGGLVVEDVEVALLAVPAEMSSVGAVTRAIGPAAAGRAGRTRRRAWW